MAEPKKKHPKATEVHAPGADMGPFSPSDEVGGIPVMNWIPHPVSDAGEYLDREDPIYMEDTDGEAA